MRSVDKGIQFLADNGLNMFAVLAVDELPEKTADFLHANNVPIDGYSRLVLTGNGGGQIWQSLQAHGMSAENPMDQFSRDLSQTFIDDYLGGDGKILYPLTDYFVPLQQFGELAGWHHPSPIGSSIHKKYGLWSAYRSVFATNAPLPLMAEELGDSPCWTCETKPCVAVCPAGAVTADNPLNLTACGDERTRDGALCADRCISRFACPVGREHKYAMQQVNYHYLISLDTIRLYRNGEN